MSSATYLPQWTRRVAMDGSGRDPLGLSRVSDSLTSFLLPNIITTTDRARYYSFYAWAIGDVEEVKSSSKRKVSFEEEFRRREAAFALASKLGIKTELPIVGITKVNEHLGSVDEDDMINTDFRVLPSNPTGGFGQYYAGCLHGLGIITANADGEPTIASDLGKRLGDAFFQSAGKATYLAGEYRSKARVPINALKKSADIFSLDAIAGKTANAERELLIRIFFELDQKPSAETPLNRQATLGMLLHVLKTCNDSGIEVTRNEIDGSTVFWPHYYEGTEDSDSNFLNYAPPPVFHTAHIFWRQFCAHQFFAFAMEELLAALLEPLGHHPEGLRRLPLLDAMVSGEYISALASVTGKKCATPADLMAALGFSAVPDVAASREFSKRINTASKLCEWTLCWSDEDDRSNRLAKAVLLLAVLYGRWRGRSDDKALITIESEAQGEWWMGSTFAWLDQWFDKQFSWQQAVGELVDELSSRHDQVKFQKRKLDASWFELANGHYIKQQDIYPDFRSSRHGNATTILQDLGLIQHCGKDDPLKITKRGREILEEVIRLRT
jgi:hypothetical protein